MASGRCDERRPFLYWQYSKRDCAAVAAAAPAPTADWSLTTNGTSFNAFAPNALASNVLTSNALNSNAIEAYAALNGRVIEIELPPTTGEVH